jgi:hypothetical protein
MTPNFTIRAPQMEDAQAIVDLTNAYMIALGFQAITTVEHTQHNWHTSGVDLNHDGWMIENETRQLVAYAQHHMREPTHFLHWGCVHSDYPHLWTELIGLCEARSRELATPHAEISMVTSE